MKLNKKNKLNKTLINY